MEYRMPMHRNVRVRANGWDASVDEQLVPLIRELWRAGIYTISSCQGGPPSVPLNPEGEAYTEMVQQDPSLADLLPPDPHLTFPGSEAEALLNLISDGKALRGGADEHPGMWDRIYYTNTNTGDPEAWRYKAWPWPFPGEYVLAVQITFPSSDVPLLTGMVAACNRYLRSPRRPAPADN